MNRFRWSALTLALVLVATAGTASARKTETINEVYDTGAHPRLSLSNINGDLTIDGWDQNRIEVKAVKSASSQDRLDDMEVRFHMDDDHLTIEVKYDDDGDWHDGHASVDFTIHVPRGTEVGEVATVNGDVDIVNIGGDVDVSSVNGTVSAERLGGHVDLSTVNGRVSLVADHDVDSIKMHSVNGGVYLVLPKKIDARINAGTVHGHIRAPDGLEVEETHFTGSSMRGTMGKGGMKVDLNTVNGSIEIRRQG